MNSLCTCVIFGVITNAVAACVELHSTNCIILATETLTENVPYVLSVTFGRHQVW